MMRRALLLAAVTVLGILLAAAGSAAFLGPSNASAADSFGTVSFGGESFAAPALWPRLRSGGGAQTCVRFDRHAVYLGAPSSVTSCHVASTGVTGAVEVEPLSDLTSWEAAYDLQPRKIGGQQALVAGPSALTHRIVAAFPAAGSVAIISYLSGSALAERILESFAPTTGSTELATGSTTSHGDVGPDSQALSAGPLAPEGRGQVHPKLDAAASARSSLFKGKGFDVCGEPSAKTMAAWKARSPYGAVGVYLGGADAACPPNPSSFPSWVATETRAGWHLFPIYVGLQSPCVNQSSLAKIKTGSAASEGRAEAANAVAEAKSYGMGAGDPIYYDMEAWNTGNARCNSTVMDFERAWTGRLHGLGYLSGFYGSESSGINVVERLYGSASAPDDIYIAAWDGKATTSGYVPATAWPDNQRIHQYSGGTVQSYGGDRLDIDRDYLDARTVGSVSNVSAELVSKTSLTESEEMVPYGSESGEVLTSSVSGASGVATGYVAISGTSCRPTLVDGQATCTLARSRLAPGDHALVATYHPDDESRYEASESPAVDLVVTSGLPTETTLEASSLSLVYGSESLDDLDVAVATSSGEPTGTVTISGTACHTELVDALASCALGEDELSPGTHLLVAVFHPAEGTGLASSQSTPLDVTVALPEGASFPSSTALSLSSPRQVIGNERAERLSVSVSGHIGVAEGSISVSGIACSRLLINGKTTCIVGASELAVGSHSLVATFHPTTTSGYAPSSSLAKVLAIRRRYPSRTTLRVSEHGVLYGREENVVIRVRVSGLGGRATGRVVVAGTRCRRRLREGSVSCRLSPRALRPGRHHLVASFQPLGDKVYAASHSGRKEVRVRRARL